MVYPCDDVRVNFSYLYAMICSILLLVLFSYNVQGTRIVRCYELLLVFSEQMDELSHLSDLQPDCLHDLIGNRQLTKACSIIQQKTPSLENQQLTTIKMD